MDEPLNEHLTNDLDAFRRRPDQLQLNPKLCEWERGLPRPIQAAKRTLWKRLFSFPVSLWRLGQTRRRLAVLHEEVGNLRTAVAAVIEAELSPIDLALKSLIARSLDQGATVLARLEHLQRGLDEQAEQTRLTVDERLDQLEAAAHRRQAVMEKRIEELQRALGEGLAQAEGKTSLRFERLAANFARDLSRQGIQLSDQAQDLRRSLRRSLRFERLARQKALGELDRRLWLQSADAPSLAGSGEAAPPPQVGAQDVLDSFYFLLEERYRGSRAEIKQRLMVYRNDFEAARHRVGASGPVIDLGCGRGELLEILKEDGFQAVGVDASDTQLEAARKQGLAVIHGDALRYLAGLETGSLLAVTGIHIVEHIPFPALAQLLQEVARVLKKGGLVLFETPNPSNLIVGATTFHFDPTHIRPLPAEVLQTLLEAVGFSQVESRPLHPSDTLEYMVREHKLDPHVATLLYGPQDYAVIGVLE